MELIMLSTTGIVALLLAEFADLVKREPFDRPLSANRSPRVRVLAHSTVPVTVAGAMPVTSDERLNRAA